MSNPMGNQSSCCNNAGQNGNNQAQAEPPPPPPKAHTCDDKPVLVNPPRAPPLAPIFPGAKDPAKSKKCRTMMEIFNKPPWVAPIREPPKYLKTFNLNKDEGISPLSQPCNCTCPPLPASYEPPAISCPDYGPPVRQESAPGLNSDPCSSATQQPPPDFPPVDQYADKALEAAQMAAARPPKCRPVLDTPKTRQFAQSVLDEAQRRLQEQQNLLSESDVRHSGAGMGEETEEYDGEGAGGYDGYNMPGCKSTKHFYSSPQDLRSRILSYIDSKDKKEAKPNPSLTPFSGFRNDKLNEYICGPSKILEMMADSCCDTEEQFLQGLGLRDPPPAGGGNCTCTADSPSNTNEAADKSINDEVNTYMSIMPPNLSCQQQLDYMECMGASSAALGKFKEIQAQAGEAGGCMAAEGGPGAPGGPGGPDVPCAGGPDPSQAPGGEPLPKPCSGILKGMSGSNTIKPPNSTSATRRMSMEQEKGCYQDYLEQLIAESREVCEQNEREKQRCPCDKIVEVVEEEDEAALRQHPCFGARPKPKERNLAETFSMYKEHLANIRRRYFGAVCKNIDEMEDMTPEVAAAMVLTEEQGMPMCIAPARMYEYLYPETPSQPVVKIGDVSEYSPPGIASLCVPLVPPLMLEAHNFPGLEDPAMLDSPRVIQIGPSMNLAEEPKITETKKPGDIVEVITGATDSYFGMNDVEEEFPVEGEEEEEEGVFEIKLDKALPPHYCRMQLRGSEPPIWFPGYWVAMPSREGVKVQNHLGTVLEQAWEETQPESVRPAGGGIIVGE